MSSTPENITHAMADDYMKANAEFRSKAGIDTYIERRDDGKCCEWCSKLAGRYRYPEQVPKDVFRRHDNCGCKVVYECGNMRQDVHSKQTWEQPTGTEQELTYNPNVAQKPLGRNPDVKQNDLRIMGNKKALTDGADSGIIESRKHLLIEDTERQRIRHDVIPKLNKDNVIPRQNIHRQGTNEYIVRKQLLQAKGEYGPPYVTISDEEILELVNKYCGTGILELNRNGNWNNTETITLNDKIIGVVVNNLTGKAVQTSAFKIHYRERGIHIVPDYPSKKGLI